MKLLVTGGCGFIGSNFIHYWLKNHGGDEIVLYKMTSEYSKDHSRGIIWNDPELGIEWPSGQHPLLSDADRSWPRLIEAETY